MKSLEDTLKEQVREALIGYQLGDHSQGYSVMRYAKKKYYRIIDGHEDTAEMFVNWYPNDPSYIILRLAQAGYLESAL
jgi:urocanate hydratase